MSDGSFVMPEEDWFALCEKQCRARRKAYPGEVDCEEDGMCSECVSDAADRVPKKYRVTAEEAHKYDPLPGLRWE